MNKLFFIFLFCSINLFSQNFGYDKVSIETGLGYSIPINNKSSDGSGQFASFSNINIGVRYMFNQKWGIKSDFSYDSFNYKDKGSNHYRVNLAAYYNVGDFFDLNYISNQSVALYSHFGGGITYNNSHIKEVQIGYIPGWEKQINVTFGLSPRFRINDHISILTDWTNIIAMRQHFYYSGEEIVSGGKIGKIGFHMTFNLGISFSIGDNDDHADFY
jgi:OOP family OmpA-OmpF porin